MPSNSSSSRAPELLLAGACACLADAATFPVDTVKVRLQMAAGAGSGVWQTAKAVAVNEGLSRFYGGLCAGLQRQFAFASIRIGFYEPVKQAYIRRLRVDTDCNAALMGVRLLAGVTTGALAVCCAQPTDVVKVRMQAADGQKFAGCLAAYSGIFRAEGLRGLWRGLGPNVARNGIVNCAEVVSYDTIKTHLVQSLHLPDSVGTHFASGLGSGFIATVVASPVDVVKTRMMSGQARGAGVLAVAGSLWKQSGVAGFYKGFLPGFVRIAGWNILMFVSYEKAKSAYAELRTKATAAGQLSQQLPAKQLL